ncbi:MAG: hypothetical protein ISS71_06865 [Phycisphaerae bacterium]|nr:hypothetical protein [Phycisphaerae bacterium]
MRREMMVLAVVVLSLGAVYLVNGVQQASAAEKKKLLRVGVYDSRGIAIAYAHSHFNDERYKKMKAELDAAEAAGDEQKAAEIKQAGKNDQAKKHLQGFGTAPVHEYLDLIKKQIPQVAETAGVDAIVSKWEFDYISSDAEVVDVTMALAKLFEPREKAYQWIEQMKDKEPIPAEELGRLEKEETCRDKTAISTKNITDKQLRQTFDAYMRACVKKDIEAMADVYDLEYIAIKWPEKAGDNLNQIREMNKGIVVNKPDEFYRMCTRAEIQSIRISEKEMPHSVGKVQIAEVKFEDWSWTFRKTAQGWKLIEEGVSGETFDRISGAQGQKAPQS